MNILWFTWKDKKNPYAGGAEVVNDQLAKRLAADGHVVVFLVRGFAGAAKEEVVDGYKVIRVGNYHTVYWEAFKYYRKNLKGWADLVIEEVNTVPFFCNFYVKEKSILFFHQLCRQIWFYELTFFKGLVGYIAESVWLLFLGNRDAITVSDSTKKNLNKFGFRRNKIKIISEGIELLPLPEGEIERGWESIKFEKPTILSLGALRPMKRTDQIIKAFELAKKNLSNLQLIIAGNPSGNHKVLAMIEASPFRDSIQCLGKVSQEKKIELMQKSHLICVTSAKEGWGLVVTEANSQGTPAIVYNVDGLRDSVKNNQTGIVCRENTPENIAENIVKLLENQSRYLELQKNGWEWSKEINFDRSYREFLSIIKDKF